MLRKTKIFEVIVIIAAIGFFMTGCAGSPSQTGIPLVNTYEKGSSELIISGEPPGYEYVYKENGENKSKGTITITERNKLRINEQYQWSGSEWAASNVSANYDYMHMVNNGQLFLRNGSGLPFADGMWRVEGTSTQIAQSGNTGSGTSETQATRIDNFAAGESYLRIAGTTKVVRINEQTVNWGGSFGSLASDALSETFTIPAGRHTLRVRGSNWDNSKKHDTIEYDFAPGQTYIVQIRKYPGHGAFIANAATGAGAEKRIVGLMPMAAVSYYPLNLSSIKNGHDLDVDLNWASMFSLSLNLFDRVSATLDLQVDDQVIGDLSKIAGSINSKIFGLKFDYQTIQGEYKKEPFRMDNTMVTLYYIWDIGIHNCPVDVGIFWKNTPLGTLDLEKENHYGLYVGVDMNGVEHNKDFLFWRMEAGLALDYIYTSTQIGWGHDFYLGKKNALTMYLGIDTKYESWASGLWSVGPIAKLRVGL